MLIQYIQLVDTQAKMKMKAQANTLMLSYLWWILEPLLLVAMFYVVFGYILQRGGENFFSFLIVGKIVFMWFSKSVTSASTSLIKNKGLIGQRSLPKWVFPMVAIQEATYKSMFSFFVMILIVIYQGYYISIEWVQLIPVTIVFYLFICSVGISLSILVCVAKDFSNIIGLIMMGLMFGSGIFWDINSLANEQLKEAILTFNPLVPIIDAYRTIILESKVIDFISLAPVFVLSSTLLVMSLYIMNRFKNEITRFLFS